MTDKELKDLNKGDIIKHKSHADSATVIFNDGITIIAVIEKEVSNPIEWDLISKNPLEKNVKIENIKQLIRKVYSYNKIGSNLHIVIDDVNVGDDSLEMCKQFIDENSHEATTDQLLIEKELLNLLFDLSECDREELLLSKKLWL